MKRKNFIVLISALSLGALMTFFPSCTDDDKKEEQKQEDVNKEDPNKGGEDNKEEPIIAEGSSSIFKYKFLSEDKVSIIGINNEIDSKKLQAVTIPDGIRIDGSVYEITDVDVEVFNDNFDNISAVKVGASNKYFKSIDGVLYKKDTLIYYPKKKKADVFEIPEGTVAVKYPIHYDWYEEDYHIGVIKIPASLTSFIENGQCEVSCESFEVDPANKIYRSFDGMLLKGDVLIYCPSYKSGKIVIPSDVKVIGKFAFGCCYDESKTIVVPSTVTKIEEDAFATCHFEEVVISEGIMDISNIFGMNSINKLVIPESVALGVNDKTFETMYGTVYLPKKWESEIGPHFGSEFSAMPYPDIVYY